MLHILLPNKEPSKVMRWVAREKAECNFIAARDTSSYVDWCVIYRSIIFPCAFPKGLQIRFSRTYTIIINGVIQQLLIRSKHVVLQGHFILQGATGSWFATKGCRVRRDEAKC